MSRPETVFEPRFTSAAGRWKIMDFLSLLFQSNSFLPCCQLPQETLKAIISIQERDDEKKRQNKQNKFQLLLGNYASLIYRVVLLLLLFVNT